MAHGGSYYYPEGYFGPICDSLVAPEDIAASQRSALVSTETFRDTYPTPPADFYDAVKSIYEPYPPFILTERCKIDKDGNPYDCEYIYLSELPKARVTISNTPWGLKDDFKVPNISADSCSPFDPDINIRPETFFDANGNAVTKYKRQKSNPVTFAVTSDTEFVQSTSTVDATFDSNGNIVVTGTGSGMIQFSFEWDDNPNTAGQALGTYSITGTNQTVTFTQTSGVESGNASNSLEVSVGTYNATITGGSGYGGFSREDNNKTLCFRDNDGNDCNATLRITGVVSIDTTSNSGYWSEEGNEYGVWVNPAVCTLPEQTQTITYNIVLPASDTYAFRFGCDDNAEVFLNDETSPLFDVAGGIFAGGSLSTPYTATRSLSAGNLRVTVRITNSDAGFQDSEGNPTGLAYDWQRNPGGYFMKICRGTACTEATAIANWVRAGAHPAWSSFMNSYAVFPVNNETLAGIAQNTQWNVNIPTPGTYELELQCDNTGSLSFDGTQVLTSSSFTSSSTVTLNNVTAGNHTIAGTVTNSVESDDTWAANPGGIAWTLTRPSSSYTQEVSTTSTAVSNISASFDTSGNLIVTGTGSGKVQLLLSWDDNPNTYGQALGKIELGGKTWRQTTGQTTGNVAKIVEVTAGSTYTINIEAGSGYGGFTRTSSSELCFKDGDGSDCNATFRINNVENDAPVTTTTTGDETVSVPSLQIANSTNLTLSGGGNLIWHTRQSTGYEYYTV